METALFVLQHIIMGYNLIPVLYYSSKARVRARPVQLFMIIFS